MSSPRELLPASALVELHAKLAKFFLAHLDKEDGPDLGVLEAAMKFLKENGMTVPAVEKSAEAAPKDRSAAARALLAALPKFEGEET